MKIDTPNDACRAVSALGEKLFGAGTGSFVRMLVPLERQKCFLSASNFMPVTRVGMDTMGSTSLVGRHEPTTSADVGTSPAMRSSPTGFVVDAQVVLKERPECRCLDHGRAGIVFVEHPERDLDCGAALAHH
jgi:hypothetical protein